MRYMVCMFNISVLILFFIISIPKSVSADVVTDGSVGPAQIISGPNFLIPDTLGTTTGTNLFHSFQNFSITDNQSATFTGPDSLTNVISRVTGGNASNIDGLLRSKIGQASFFIINPNGIVFGPNAVVDVPAAFHVSTANELRFEDGAIFSASSPDASTLTLAEPISFGFLDAQSASIEVNGSLLEFTPTSKVSFSSGDMKIQGSDTKIVSMGGEIRLTAMGNETGDVPINDTPLLKTPKGLISLDQAKISTSGNPAGTITIASKNLDLNQAAIRSTAIDGQGGGININASGLLSLHNDSDITANNLGTGNGPNIKIKVKDAVINSGSVIDSRTNGTGPSGGILIDVEDKITISGTGSNNNPSSILSGITGNAEETGSFILLASELQLSKKGNLIVGNTGSGDGADMSINLDSLTISDGGQIVSINSNTGSGGDILISLTGDMTMTDDNTAIKTQMGSGIGGGIHIYSGGKVKMEEGAVISIASLNNDSGIGGDLNIHAASIELNSGSQIYANCDLGTSGQVGDIFIEADQFVSFNGHKNSVSSGIGSQFFGDGGVGQIEIQTPLLTIEQGAKIAAQNYSPLTGTIGSDITIHVNDLVIRSDNSNDTSGASEIVNSAAVDWQTVGSGAGDSGSIQITAQNQITIDGNNNLWGATIRNGSIAGNGGEMKIIANELGIFNNGLVLATTHSGAAGDIAINVDRLNFRGGEISNSVKSTGTAGTIHIDATESIQVEGAKEAPLSLSKISQIDSLTLGKGQAGSIFINTPFFYVGQGGSIATTTHGKGDGGRIAINSSQFIIQDGAYVSSSAWTGSQGNAGTVEITTNGLLEMDSGAQISSYSSATGNAGSVTINAEHLIIDGQGGVNSTGISSQAYSEGDAGTVNVTVDGLMELINGAEISSSTSSVGNAGNVRVNAGELIINGQDGIFSTGITSEANPYSAGNAGNVQVTVETLLEMTNDAQISSSTWAKGNAGDVDVDAGKLRIDGINSLYYTGITSEATYTSEGNAGTIKITVDELMEMTNDALVSSSTFGKGDAGSVTVNAETLRINGESTGVYSKAYSMATGYVGDVQINANTIGISDGGKISISASQTVPDENLAHVPQNLIRINTRNLHLDGNSSITAQSSGNTPAGAINIQANSAIVENSGRITTSANDANGGNITIQADTLFLNDGLVTTSVEGTKGDGGDITITGLNTNEIGHPADALVLKGGFVQANTGAEQASGGNIYINTSSVVVDANGELEVGGEQRHVFQAGRNINVIQAAAPGGEQGTINITAPEIDISSSIALAHAYLVNSSQLATDACRLAANGIQGNSLVQGSRGGIPHGPEDPSTVSYMGKRLDNFLNKTP